MRLRILFAAALAIAVPAAAADKTIEVKLTTEQAIELLDVLSNRMETYEKIVQEGGKDVSKKVFFELKPATRMAMARNIQALAYVTKPAEKARNDYLMELSGGKGRIEPGSAEHLKLQGEWAKLIQQPNTFNLIVLTEDELKLAVNPFSTYTLSVLLPICPTCGS